MKEHIKYLDTLRLIACIMVVGIHTSGIDFYNSKIALIFDCACGFAVPIFVTISGACFIGRISDYKLIVKKFSYLIIAYFLWSVFYLIITNRMNLFSFSFSNIIKEIVKAHYHMWYIRMIIFLYCFVAILNEIYKN